MKRCSVCREKKPLSEFPKRREAPDGHRANCKVCKAAEAERYRLENAAKERLRKQNWAKRNRERVRVKKRTLYLAHREKIIARVAARYTAKREEILAQRRADYAADPTERLAVNRARQALTSGAANAEIVRRTVVFKRDGGLCGICGNSVDPDRWHLDHKTPLALGGAHTYANVHVTHPTCNLRKSARPLEDLAA